jgi:hypothetical protein
VHAGPMVRIRLPPGASQQRTVRLLEIERITGSHAATGDRSGNVVEIERHSRHIDAARRCPRTPRFFSKASPQSRKRRARWILARSNCWSISRKRCRSLAHRRHFQCCRASIWHPSLRYARRDHANPQQQPPAVRYSRSRHWRTDLGVRLQSGRSLSAPSTARFAYLKRTGKHFIDAWLIAAGG